MKELRIYIDTSVVGGCLDDEFKDPSRKLIDLFAVGQAFLLASDLLFRELEEAPAAVQVVLSTVPVERMERVRFSEEADRLKQCYLDAEVVGAVHANDALHVALATVTGGSKSCLLWRSCNEEDFRLCCDEGCDSEAFAQTDERALIRATGDGSP